MRLRDSSIEDFAVDADLCWLVDMMLSASKDTCRFGVLRTPLTSLGLPFSSLMTPEAIAMIPRDALDGLRVMAGRLLLALRTDFGTVSVLLLRRLGNAEEELLDVILLLHSDVLLRFKAGATGAQSLASKSASL